MKIIGLTGGMGMGKSTISRFLQNIKIPVYDADARVHALYRDNLAVIRDIAQLTKGCIIEGVVDRTLLSKWVMENNSNLPRLTRLVLPYLQLDMRNWIREQKIKNTKIIVCDLPLLFETTNILQWDKIITVDVIPLWQRRRILARNHMTARKMQFILRYQWSNRKRKVHSTDIIHTGLNYRETYREIRKILSNIR
jgi:dephospho-CoA kinase